jgi:hypothetical protein
MIELFDDDRKHFLTDVSEVAALREISSQQSVRIFIRSPLPG